MKNTLNKMLFTIAGMYDLLIGLVFLFFAKEIFAFYRTTPPNYIAYVQFPALLLMIFAIMFFKIAANPAKNRDLIQYGCALKMSYVGIVFYYQATTGVPAMWLPWAWADLVFLVFFVLAWIGTNKKELG